jgi:hypothetical protein
LVGQRGQCAGTWRDACDTVIRCTEDRAQRRASTSGRYGSSLIASAGTAAPSASCPRREVHLGDGLCRGRRSTGTSLHSHRACRPCQHSEPFAHLDARARRDDKPIGCGEIGGDRILRHVAVACADHQRYNSEPDPSRRVRRAARSSVLQPVRSADRKPRAAR